MYTLQTIDTAKEKAINDDEALHMLDAGSGPGGAIMAAMLPVMGAATVLGVERDEQTVKRLVKNLKRHVHSSLLKAVQVVHGDFTSAAVQDHVIVSLILFSCFSASRCFLFYFEALLCMCHVTE
jgi:predicted RNA methylase